MGNKPNNEEPNDVEPANKFELAKRVFNFSDGLTGNVNKNGRVYEESSFKKAIEEFTEKKERFYRTGELY